MIRLIKGMFLFILGLVAMYSSVSLSWSMLAGIGMTLLIVGAVECLFSGVSDK